MRILFPTAIGCLLQVVGGVRAIIRSPDDWIGIGLYMVTAVALAIASMGFALRARQS